MVILLEIFSQLCDQKFIKFNSKVFPTSLQHGESLPFLQLGLLGKGGAGICAEPADRVQGSTGQ